LLTHSKGQARLAPGPHSSRARPPEIPQELVPRQVAIVMDGNGRWAKARNLPRIEGHKAGEASLLDVISGGIEIGVKYISAYAFSTENWARSPEEVRFLMGFNRDVVHRRCDELDAMGVRVVWSGAAAAVVEERDRRAGVRAGADQGHDHAAVLRELRRPGGARRRDEGDRARRCRGQAQAGPDQRDDGGTAPVRDRTRQRGCRRG
jgi:undecaprenyl pyrophosphate synthase